MVQDGCAGAAHILIAVLLLSVRTFQINVLLYKTLAVHPTGPAAGPFLTYPAALPLTCPPTVPWTGLAAVPLTAISAVP